MGLSPVLRREYTVRTQQPHLFCAVQVSSMFLTRLRGASTVPCDPTSNSFLRQTITHECEAMAAYALGAGAHVPPEFLPALEAAKASLGAGVDGETLPPVDLIELTRMHAALADLVAPATPRAISLLHEQKFQHPILSSFGAVPIVRRVLMVALVSLALMLLSALSQYVNPVTMKQDLVEGHGLSLFFCEIFLASASCLGSSFAALFRLNKYVTNGTFDPYYRSSYWIQLVLGVVAGMVLSGIIFHSIKSDTSTSILLDQPLLALLGGFSSGLVYRVLTRIMDAIESIFGKRETETAATVPSMATRRARQAVVAGRQESTPVVTVPVTVAAQSVQSAPLPPASVEIDLQPTAAPIPVAAA